MLVMIEGARGGEGGEQDNARGTRDVPTSQTVTVQGLGIPPGVQYCRTLSLCEWFG